jgi:hypothetical protein
MGLTPDAQLLSEVGKETSFELEGPGITVPVLLRLKISVMKM